MQLESYQLAAHAFKDLVDHNLIGKKMLSFREEMVKNYIDELEVCEKTGNQIKCGHANDSANYFLEQIRVLLEQIVSSG